MNKRRVLLASILMFCFISINGQSKTTLSSSINKNLYTLNVEGMSMAIDGAKGARIISLKFNGDELLGSNSLHSKFYGSTLWLSPEGKWKGQGLLDSGIYKLIFFDGNTLQLKSKNDSLRGFFFSKQFQRKVADTSIIINYSIINISKEAQDVAPWEVTRVPTGGLAFFPRGKNDVPKANKVYPLLPIKDSIGVIWYPYDSSPLSPQKLFINGSEGWTAYVKNRMLLVKKFPVVKADKTAPNEKNIELYVNKNKTYLELENQGEYQKLNSGDSLTYMVKWYARKLPENLKVEIGNTKLVNYIRNLINK